MTLVRKLILHFNIMIISCVIQSILENFSQIKWYEWKTASLISRGVGFDCMRPLICTINENNEYYNRWIDYDQRLK